MDIGSSLGARVHRQDLFIYWAMGVAAGQSFIAIMMGVDTPLAMMKLGASPVILGISYSAWAIGRAGTGMLAGYLFDQYGGKRGILVSFGMLAMVAWGYGMLLGPEAMVGLRFCQGAAAGIYWTSMLAMVGHNVQPVHRVRRLAVFNGAVALGGIAGGLIGGWLVSQGGFHAPFTLAFAMALGILVMVWWTFPQSVSIRRSKQRAHRVQGSGVMTTSVLGGLSQVPSLLSNAAAPLELARFGLGATVFGMESAALVFGNLLGQILIFRKPALIVKKSGTSLLYGVGIVAILGISYAPDGWVLVAMLALLGSMVSIYSVVWTAAIQARVVDGETGRATGSLRMTGDAMSAASFPLVGWVEQEPGLSGVALVALLGGSLVYAWRHHDAIFRVRPSPLKNLRSIK